MESTIICSCCGAGTAADTEMTTKMISSQLELHRLNTHRTAPVPCAATLLNQHLSRWQPDMNEEDGKKVVRDAIAAGIFNDLGSGSNVDLCIIRKNSTEYLRNYELANIKGKRLIDYTFKRGTTGVLSVKTIPFQVVEESVAGVEQMDTN